MGLEHQLNDRLTQAIKGKDTRTADVVRMIKTRLQEQRTMVMTKELFAGPNVFEMHEVIQRKDPEARKVVQRVRETSDAMDLPPGIWQNQGLAGRGEQGDPSTKEREPWNDVTS